MTLNTFKEEAVSEKAGEIWREIKHELESRGVKLPLNFDGIGAACGSYVRIGDALAAAHALGRKEAIDEITSKSHALFSALQNFIQEKLKGV